LLEIHVNNLINYQPLWDKITAVAEALIERETLSGKAVRELIEAHSIEI